VLRGLHPTHDTDHAAAAAQPAPDNTHPTAKSFEDWRAIMSRTPAPKSGCFTSTYPSTEWKQVPCVTARPRPLSPRRVLRPDTVGNGLDWSAGVSGTISTATGSFDSLTGVTSECNVECPNGNCPPNPTCTQGTANNTYSLQLNTQNSFQNGVLTGFRTPACAFRAMMITVSGAT
jgi:hypothetical protein